MSCTSWYADRETEVLSVIGLQPRYEINTVGVETCDGFANSIVFRWISPAGLFYIVHKSMVWETSTVVQDPKWSGLYVWGPRWLCTVVQNSTYHSYIHNIRDTLTVNQSLLMLRRLVLLPLNNMKGGRVTQLQILASARSFSVVSSGKESRCSSYEWLLW